MTLGPGLLIYDIQVDQMSVGQMSLIERFESTFDNLTAWTQVLMVQHALKM